MSETKSVFDKVVTIILVAVCVILAFAIFFKYNQSQSTGQGQDPAQMMARSGSGAATQAQAVNVSAMTIQTGDFIKTTAVGATVVNKTKSQTLTSTQSGTLKYLNVTEGQYLNIGDVICVVDPSKPGTLYKEVEVKAIAAGKVTDINVIEGQEVSTSTALVVIEPTAELYIQTYLPEKYYNSVSIGTNAVFTSEALPDQSIEALVSEKSSSINESDWTFALKFTPTSAENLVSGMYLRGQIETLTLPDVISIPKKAISTLADEQYVYVIVENQAQKRVITTGEESGTQVIVTSGLSDGDVLITAGSVTEQSLVRVI